MSLDWVTCHPVHPWHVTQSSLSSMPLNSVMSFHFVTSHHLMTCDSIWWRVRPMCNMLLQFSDMSIYWVTCHCNGNATPFNVSQPKGRSFHWMTCHSTGWHVTPLNFMSLHWVTRHSTVWHVTPPSAMTPQWHSIQCYSTVRHVTPPSGISLHRVTCHSTRWGHISPRDVSDHCWVSGHCCWVPGDVHGVVWCWGVRHIVQVYGCPFCLLERVLTQRPPFPHYAVDS